MFCVHHIFFWTSFLLIHNKSWLCYLVWCVHLLDISHSCGHIYLVVKGNATDLRSNFSHFCSYQALVHFFLVSTFPLWFPILSFMLDIVQYVAFTVFLLKHLWSLWPFGKCLSVSLRNNFITLVSTDLLNSGLKYMTLSDFLFLLVLLGSWYVRFTSFSLVDLYFYPLFFNAFLYWAL